MLLVPLVRIKTNVIRFGLSLEIYYKELKIMERLTKFENGIAKLILEKMKDRRLRKHSQPTALFWLNLDGNFRLERLTNYL